MLFSDYVDDGVMWSGSGDRESRHIVTFKEPFSEAPAVVIGASMWDTDCDTNARVDLSAEHVTPTGFHIVFKTWSDTRVARIRADWMAIGAVRGEDDWDVQ